MEGLNEKEKAIILEEFYKWSNATAFVTDRKIHEKTFLECFEKIQTRLNLKEGISKTKVMFWDWQEQIDIVELNKGLKPYGVKVVETDDYSDSYGVVIGSIGLTKKQAREIWQEELDRIEEE